MKANGAKLNERHFRTLDEYKNCRISSEHPSLRTFIVYKRTEIAKNFTPRHMVMLQIKCTDHTPDNIRRRVTAID